MRTYAKVEDYEALYARYLEKPVSDMVDLAGDVEGKVVWDLCCGAGALSGECLRRGAAKVHAVDACPEMTYRLRMSFMGWQDALGGRFRLEVADVESWFRCAYADAPDFVFCRQAVNYWMNERTAAALAASMGKGSVFVFNTFNNKPLLWPTVKEYEFGGKAFVEVSWLVPPDTVYHVQMREGMGAHQTEFRWIPSEEYERLLGPSFEVEETRRGASSTYRCVRK